MKMIIFKKYSPSFNGFYSKKYFKQFI